MKSAQHKSQVARLLTEIQEEYESAMLGLGGLSAGSAKHRVISRKTTRMYELQEELADILGTCAMTMAVDLQLQNCPTSQCGGAP